MKKTFKIQHTSMLYCGSALTLIGGLIREDTEVSSLTDKDMLSISLAKDAENQATKNTIAYVC